MTSQRTDEMQWVGIDLHVHTPASKDYKGSREDSEYLGIVRSANELERVHGRRRSHRNPIGCIAFTDHNSIDGFRTYRKLSQDAANLRDLLRSKDPSNTYIQDLENEIRDYYSIRILMGIEVKADPGIHLLIVFQESVEEAPAVKFLEEAYGAQYTTISGDPTPTARWTVLETLSQVQARFGDRAMVIAPHVDTGGGVFEGLRDYGQTRMEVLKSPMVRALSFNKPETRDRLLQLFRQPDYQRAEPIALIQSSDFHGAPGASIGQLRTDIHVSRGKASFQQIREAFKSPKAIKCTIDFVEEEYERLTSNRTVQKFSSETGQFRFKESDYDNIAQTCCAMLNSGAGVIVLEGAVSSDADSEHAPQAVEQLSDILAQRVQPPDPVKLFGRRELRVSPGKTRVLMRVDQARRLYACDGSVYVLEKGKPKKATPSDIEAVVSRNIDLRFGHRFQNALEKASTQSVLLSKVPHGIALLLRCQDRLRFGLPTAALRELDPKGDDHIDELYEKIRSDASFGFADGNVTFLPAGPTDPREEEHYLRFTAFRADVSDKTLLNSPALTRVDHPSLVFLLGGNCELIECGQVYHPIPALLMQPTGEWQAYTRALLAWFKSSFFLWYSAVHLGNTDLSLHLRFQRSRIVVPAPQFPEFYRRLGLLADNVILEEQKFLRDFEREKRRGSFESAEQEKARVRHNSNADRLCMSIDHEIADFLGLSDEETKFVATTMRDLKWTDFGYVKKIKAEQAKASSDAVS